ncbi:molybdate ABC transporter substrate-binding protein [Oleomonas cavernae]|uniref:Molybdate ABC transporter substrate-binding protein n=1 Tax=Oleomonas cavernae TaxID=2320859 RepID=A0A418WT26_9PROT|nr:molybdate ABC transporter substrate-binding protein [Oleomonas cavernae]RJF94423.1 molybdate ABC transporter substrate-binding protein [Oleomonas cavernae]
MLINRRRWLQSLTAGVMLAAAVLAPARAEDKPVLVFAAASLKNAVDELAAAYTKETGKTIQVSYAASSALAKQIEGGAPADIFISADLKWMAYLSGKGLTKKETERPLLGNELVLVASKDSTVTATIEKGFDLAALLGDGRLAMGEVSSVPAGVYGKASLTSLGVWDSVKDRLAQAENVRAALALVSRGEAPLGIVYATDARADPGVKVVGTFPADSHDPIVYPIALLDASTNPDAAAVLAFLESATARPVYEGQGFTVLDAPKTN